MQVGNDVVDLQDPENQPEALHPRWDLRVFTEEERRKLAEALEPHLARWRMWAAKESAFKAARKMVPDVPFFPSEFVVELRDQASALVRHEIGRFDVWLQETADCVHAVATREGQRPPLTRVRLLEAATLASTRVREMAQRAVASVLSLDPTEVEIAAVDGVPIAKAFGDCLPVDLSLSHHGRFIACAWAVRSPLSP